jgi:histidinol-phosphate/aromatic aminotransferase/cobyric acid decarboxylase-like protein
VAGVAVPPPGEHGGDGAGLAAALGIDAEGVLDLSASLNPCAPDVVALAARRLGSLRRYPDPAVAAGWVAEAVGVEAGRVVLTNGGAEAIALVAAEVGAGWVEPPEFSLYARHLPALRPGAGRWRSNPNNPTGLLAGVSARAAVWDEAFWPLATGTWTRGDADRGSWVVGSFTKTFACPGLRLGYVLAPDAASAARLRDRQPRWAVSGLACALVPDLLALADLAGWAGGVRVLRARLVAVLRAAGFEPRPSDAPWVLVPDADGLRERLAHHAVLVRDCATFGLPGIARVAVPDEPGLDRLATALATS